MILYIVSRGEEGNGSSVVGVRTRLDEAEILAQIQEAHFGEWMLDEDEKPEECQNGQTVKSWFCGCDYVKIEKWSVQCCGA